jgi:hypothetical protein
MFTHLTYDGDELAGVLVTQLAEGELRENQFWVSREEVPDVIRMLAEAFDMYETVAALENETWDRPT